MAKILENGLGRRNIRLNTDDIIDIVREYQRLTLNCNSYEEIRSILSDSVFFIPEDK